MDWPCASAAPTPRPYSCSLGGYLVGLELRDLPPAFGISIVIWAFSRRSRPKRRLWRCCQPAIGQGQCQDRAGLPSLSRPHFTTLRSPPPRFSVRFHYIEEYVADCTLSWNTRRVDRCSRLTPESCGKDPLQKDGHPGICVERRERANNALSAQFFPTAEWSRVADDLPVSTT